MRTAAFLDDKFSSLRKQIEFEQYIDDSTTQPRAFLDAKAKLISLQANNPYDAIVIDSLTGLARCIRLHVMSCTGNALANPQIQHWGQMVTELESILSLMRSFKCLAMVTAHTTDAEFSGQQLVLPMSVTEPHSKSKLTWLFNDVFFSKLALKPQGKIDWVMTNSINLGRVVKNQSCPPADYVVSEIGLAGLLDKMGYKYPPVKK
jgi:hypothetical protein